MRMLPLLFIFSSLSIFGQKTIYKNYESEELKDTREITIHLPKGYEKDSISNFPLAIVLDGHKLFDLYVGVSNHYASQDNAPEQIIVGIDMKDTRLKDVSFDITNGELTENSERFYFFLRDELIPYVEANYKTSPFLTIVGESLTSNFITHFLKEQTPIFNAYICLNPTLTKDINNQIQKYDLEKMQALDNTFYFYISGNPFAKTEKLNRANAFGKFMKTVAISNFHVVFDKLSSSPNSSSVIGEGMSRAFAKIFEIYSGITKDEYDEKIKNLSPPDAIAYLETKYLDIEFLFGSNIGIRKSDVIAIENIIIEKENGYYLKDFGKMILNLYPNSEMGNYYLGRYYENQKNYKNALKEYRIGYGKMNPLNPNADLFYRNVERILGKF